jgi:hypothetical protein
MPESLLDYALLWVPTELSQRRLQQPENRFPSWSWAGWHVEVDYETILRTEIGFEPYVADMESLIHRLSIYDWHGPRRVQSSVPVNEDIAKLAIKAGGSLQSDQQFPGAEKCTCLSGPHLAVQRLPN